MQDRIGEALKPYVMDITEVLWVDRFAVRKFLAQRFLDQEKHVVLLGDAAHVHSPLIKQNINGGMLDAWNLCWKLTLVIRGNADESLLDTYELERRAPFLKALELEDRLDSVYAVGLNDPVASAGFVSFEEASGYASGCGLRYPRSALVKEEVRANVQKTSDSLTPGKRLLPGRLIKHIDGNEVNSLEVLRTNVCFTLVIFAGELLDTPVFRGLSNFLSEEGSPLTLFDAAGDRPGERVSVCLVHTKPHLNMSVPKLPPPWPQYADNIFEDVFQVAHRVVGIPAGLGGMCLLRPDGYVGMVTNLDDGRGVRKYLRNIFRNSRVDNEIVQMINDARMEIG